jgi:hypothetical protein
VGRKKKKDRDYNWNKNNWDRRDGIKVHRIQDNRKVSGYASSVTMWDIDNIVMDNPNSSGFIHVSIVKVLRHANSAKCRKMNGYNGKLNGR